MIQFCTENPVWGFYGTIAQAGHPSPAEAFDIATKRISAATGEDPFKVARFLDSRDGADFAGDVAPLRNFDDALSAAIARWMRWKSSATGLDYLTDAIRETSRSL